MWRRSGWCWRFTAGAVMLLGAACGSSGFDRGGAIELLVDDGGLERDVATCVVDGIDEHDDVSISNLDDNNPPDSVRRAVTEITADCLLADAGLAGGTDDSGESGEEPGDVAQDDTADAVDSQSGDSAGLDPDRAADEPPGTDAELDALWVSCAAGDDGACVQLFWSSETGSDYEAFGRACGGRNDGCTDLSVDTTGLIDFSDLSSDDPAPGGDAELDALWDDCGNGSAFACDTLFFDSPLGSDYERFGYSCGARAIADCTELLGDDSPPNVDQGGNAVDFEGLTPDSSPPGDDADLDALWIACGGGDAAACVSLYVESPIDSQYELFGLSCGAREIGDCEQVIAGA